MRKFLFTNKGGMNREVVLSLAVVALLAAVALLLVTAPGSVRKKAGA